MQRSSATGQRVVGHTKAFKTGLLRSHKKNRNKFATGAHSSITAFLGVWVSTSLWKDNIPQSFPCPSAFRAWCTWAGGLCQPHCNACPFSCEVFKSSHRAVNPTAHPLLHCIPSKPSKAGVSLVVISREDTGMAQGSERCNFPVDHRW